MGSQEVQTFLEGLLTNDGLMSSLEVVEEVSSVKIRKSPIWNTFANSNNHVLRKLIQADGKETTNPEKNSKKIFSFYEVLFDKKLDRIIYQETCPFLNSPNIPELTPS